MTNHKEKFLSKEFFIAYAYLIAGSLLFAVGDVMFVNPYLLAPGGTYGLANVFNSLWPWKISYYAFCMDIPLLIVGTLVLGPRFGVKTIISTFLILGGVFVLESTWGYAPVIHDGLLANVAQGQLAFVPDYILNTLIAGLIYGLAIGMIFKSGATSGGSDIISMILNKYTKISLGTLVMIVDSTITLTTLFAFGQFRLPIYSILLILIESKIIDLVIEGPKRNKTLFIISEQYEQVRELILHEIKRGGTFFQGVGLYEGKERKMIYTTMSRSEFIKLKAAIYRVDPQAFINVMDSSDTLGKGFTPIEVE